MRGGMGLGDALYLQSIARHLTEQGERVQVCSSWPDVFRAVTDVVVSPFTRLGVDRLAHYTMRKSIAGTSQFEDCCISAGIKGSVDLRIDWARLTAPVIPTHKPIVCVALPRNPMGRVDGFGAELLPDGRVIQDLIDALRPYATLVQIGKGEPLYRFSGLDLDLANRTTVAEMIDVASMASAFLGYCSYLVPLAESFGKPGLFVWSARGLAARQVFVRQITPQKVLHRPTSRHVVDDWSNDRIMGALDGFL